MKNKKVSDRCNNKLACTRLTYIYKQCEIDCFCNNAFELFFLLFVLVLQQTASINFGIKNWVALIGSLQ